MSERIRIVFAASLPDCECCDDKWCPLHAMHYADCECVGPCNAEELGYKLVEDRDGVLWGERGEKPATGLPGTKEPEPKKKNPPFYICINGHTHRAKLCECRAKSFLKTSPEGLAIIERMKDRPKSHGYKKRDGRTGVREKHRAFGDSESPAAPTR